MNSPTAPGSIDHSNLEVLWEDGERIFYRGVQRGNSGRGNVLIVLPAAEYPTAAALERFTHEFRLRDELDPAWSVRPLGLIRDGSRTGLMIEDSGGEPLDCLLDAPMEIESFLHLAARITLALGKLHQRGLVHKDIKPANIIVNRATGDVRFTGFGLASRLPRERQPPETIAGTLAYMAPEQTGRMNRSIDSRSDLYALGITLYRMLTGALPFSASDPMEWVHCHVAKNPVPPGARLNNVPAPVSAIIMRLLAKAPEDRYQTAAGLEHDLRYCLAGAQGRLDSFPLGERDIPDRLQMPEKLYGRAREIEILLSSFGRVVKTGAPELVLVSGYSGVGKSSVVNELHSVLVSPRGLFASGKFDQYKRDIPYSTLAQAFQGLTRSVLGKSEPELDKWRASLRDALGPNGQLVLDLVPELKLIVGSQPPVVELPPHDAQRRFQLVFRRFLSVFARPEHPLVLFLDDLQWIDSATLDLLEDLLTQRDVQHLMLIGAYRDNEVGSGHPLIRKLEAIDAVVHKIILGPLTRGDLGQLISDALHCDTERAMALAQLIHDKTGGNPFFANQLISVLVEESLLVFDGEGRWSWDIGRIHAKRYSDNVVDLMIGKLSRLPVETQQALQLLACIGNSADVDRLQMVSQQSNDKMHHALGDAVRAGLIFHSEQAYTFLHDRIQEAAYSLIPPDARRAAHLRIGRLLAEGIPSDEQEEAIFEIVNQLNRGSSLITSHEDREQLAELNLIAGKRAKASSAYVSALAYLSAGAMLLPEDAWSRRQALAFALELSQTDCELWTGELSSAEQRLAALAARAVDTVQRAAVASRRVDLYTMLGVIDRAVAVGLEFLQSVGINWPADPTEADAHREYERIWSALGGRAIEELVELPLMHDPESLATLDLLTILATPAMYTDLNLFALITCRAVNLSVERGNSDAAPAHFSAVGWQAGDRFGDYEAGYRFGKIGCDLTERSGLTRFGGKTYSNFALTVPYTRPVRERIGPARRAFQLATEQADPSSGAYACSSLISTFLTSGDPLDQVEGEAEHGLEFARTIKFGSIADRISAPLALVRTLRGKAERFGSLDTGGFTEQAFEERLTDQATRALPECFYWIRKLQARFFAGDHPGAVEAARNAEKWFSTSASVSIFVLESADYHFYAALSRAAYCEPAGPDPYVRQQEALARHHAQLKSWAANCPANFESRVALVGAEIARIEGRVLDAEHLYEQAIRSAGANGFVHNEALAYELAARFYAAREFNQIADLYLRSARHGYLRWGAVGKVRQLDETYPNLRQDERLIGPTGTIGTPVEYLDLATVIKVSQAISSEIVLEKLIDTLMHTAMMQAGAERALLIVPHAQEPRIEAEATTDHDRVTVRLVDDALTERALPQSVVNYVLRTGEIVILDDAPSQSPFSEDPYVRQRLARSILCLPLLNQAKLIGALYLENGLAPGVFAPARVMVLKLLASQAAIALENAHLYRDVAERETKIRRLVDSNIIGIFIWDFDGRILEANDAFLRMVDYDRDDLTKGRIKWTDLTPVDWRDWNSARIERQKLSGRFEPSEKEYVRKDGSRVPVLVGGATFDADGSQGVAFVLDLTERKRAEEALRESEAKFSDYAAGASDWLWETGPDYRFTLLTENAFRSNPADRIGSLCWDHALDLEAEPEKWRAVWLTLDERRSFVDFVYCSTDGGGYPMYVKASGKPVFGIDGEFRGYRGTGTDVTAIMRAQQAEASLLDAEKELRDTQAKLARASQAATVAELSASIAHEINQPLTGIVASAQTCRTWLAGESPNLPRARAAIDRIVRDSNAAADIIRNIRALFKQTAPTKSPLHINEVIDEVSRLARDDLNRRGVSLELHLAEVLPPVPADRIQIQQALMNLIRNGAEAMEEAGSQGKRLVVRSYCRDGRIVVEVYDVGPGLAHPDRAFDPFYSTKQNGLGVGLTISRSIVQAHGGALGVRDNRPQGAVFWFTLPLWSEVEHDERI
ncbi:ATP-binding sensor histidine kinase [Bradyrhizobium sp. USDA 4502]